MDGPGKSSNHRDLPLEDEQAAHLRGLVRAAFASRGLEVIVHAEHVRDQTGREFGMWNLAATCASEPIETWPAIVAGHVDLMLRNMRPGVGTDTISADTLERSVMLRAIDSRQLPRPNMALPGMNLGDSVVTVLAVDQPETVAMPGVGFWDRYGGRDRWIDLAAANLRAVLDTGEFVHDRLSGPDGKGSFQVVVGESFFTATLGAHHLPAVLDRFSPNIDLAAGLLVVLPHRHQIAYAPVGNPDENLVNINALFGFAIHGYTSSPGAISPHIYHVRDNKFKQITLEEGEKRVVHIDDDTSAALGFHG